MKKLLALLLCLVICLGLFAGCGGGKTDDNKGNGDVNADGKITLTIGIPKNPLVIDLDDNRFTEWLEERTGYNIEFMPFQLSSGDAKTQLSTMMISGEKLPDILYNFSLSEDLIKEYGDDEYFIDMKPYFDDKEGASKNFWDALATLPEDDQKNSVRKMTDPDNGAMYALPCIQTSQIDIMDYQIWINQTWLDELNLTAPSNPDELYNVLKAFKTAYPDSVPMIGCESAMSSDIVNWVVNMFIYNNDKRVWNVDENGKLYMPATQDAYREALQYMNKLVEEGLMSPLCWTIKNTEMQTITTPADGSMMCGIFAGHLSLHVTPGNEGLYNYQPLNCYGSAVLNDNIYRETTFITADCENPDAAFDLCMELYTWDAGMRLRYGEYGVNWKDADAGTTSNLGLTAIYKILDDPFAKLNSCLWGDMACSILPNAEGETAQSSEDMDEWTKYKNDVVAKQVEYYQAAAEKNNPKNMLPLLIQTTEEKEEIKQIKSDVLTIVSQYRAKFANGEADINSDKEWNDYLAQLDELGLAQYQAQSQAIYDRTVG